MKSVDVTAQDRLLAQLEVSEAMNVARLVRDDPNTAQLELALADRKTMHSLVLTLAALVQDDCEPHKALAWLTDSNYADSWRAGLSQTECARWHAAWARGERGWSALHGNREWERRRAKGKRLAALDKARRVSAA